MNQRMIAIIMACIASLLISVTAFSSEIYKVVDKDGNVIFTDEPPGDGSEPMDLPPLSVIETEKPMAGTSAQQDASTGADDKDAMEFRPSELRKIYRDFKITQPQNEETFWGTANAVFVSWSSSTNPTAGMSARLFVDGEAQQAPASGGLTLMLDRGEHKVRVQLLDAQNRVIIVSEEVTFYVKLNSVDANSALARPGRGN